MDHPARPAPRIRVLQAGDEPAVETFLRSRAESSMFLRSNCHAAGLEDRGEPLQGTYVAAFRGDAMMALAAHFWNGMIVVQAPENLTEVVRAAADATGAPIRGIGGTWDQVKQARRALGLEQVATVLESHEDLFDLLLVDLRVPSLITTGKAKCRRPRDDELDTLSHWHALYSVETLGSVIDDVLVARCRDEMERLQKSGGHWLLEVEGSPVSYSAFNACIPDCVQIGGVFTPPALRGRGYARSVVAGSLLEARDEGVTRAVLFTGQDNRPAKRAYESLGFHVVGDYGLVIFGNPIAYRPT